MSLNSMLLELRLGFQVETRLIVEIRVRTVFPLSPSMIKVLLHVL